LLAAGILLSESDLSFGQTVPRWEFGPAISLSRVDGADGGDRNRAFGIGGRGVLNFSELLGADLLFAHAYRSEYFPGQASVYSASGSRSSEDQLFLSLKATWRKQKVWKIMPFGIAGMGLTRLGFESSTFYPSGTVSQTSNDASRFTLRLGGGAEIVPSNRVSLRLDVADLSTPQRVMTFCGRSTCGPEHIQWWNRWDVSVGLMFRLGSVHF